MQAPGIIVDRLLGVAHGHPGLSLVCVARHGGQAFALERMRKGQWRRLHSYTAAEAQALAELCAVWLALEAEAEPGLGFYDEFDAEGADLEAVPF